MVFVCWTSDHCRGRYLGTLDYSRVATVAQTSRHVVSRSPGLCIGLLLLSLLQLGRGAIRLHTCANSLRTRCPWISMGLRMLAYAAAGHAQRLPCCKGSQAPQPTTAPPVSDQQLVYRWRQLRRARPPGSIQATRGGGESHGPPRPWAPWFGRVGLVLVRGGHRPSPKYRGRQIGGQVAVPIVLASCSVPE